MKARAYYDTSPEMKQEIMERVPEEASAFINAFAKRFGRLHFVGVKWDE